MSYTGKISELKSLVRDFCKTDNQSYSNQLKTIDPMIKIDYNVYDSGPTMGEYVEEQIRTHAFLKWRVLYPMLWFSRFIKRKKTLLLKPFAWFAKKQLGKYYGRPYPTHAGFTKIRIIDNAFELALQDFVWYGLVYAEKGNRGTEEDFKKKMSNEPIPLLRELKNIVMHVVKNDTAYINFMNCFALRLATEMNKAYPDNIAHTLYLNSKITDFAYFYASMAGDRVTLKEIRGMNEQDAVMDTRTGEIRHGTQTTQTANKL